MESIIFNQYKDARQQLDKAKIATRTIPNGITQSPDLLIWRHTRIQQLHQRVEALREKLLPYLPGLQVVVDYLRLCNIESYIDDFEVKVCIPQKRIS